METRALYKQKYEAQLHEWSAKLEELGARADKLTAQAKLDVRPHVDTAHGKLEAAKAKLLEVAVVTDDKWDDVKTGAEHAWSEVKAAVQGAYDALEAPAKK